MHEECPDQCRPKKSPHLVHDRHEIELIGSFLCFALHFIARKRIAWTGLAFIIQKSNPTVLERALRADCNDSDSSNTGTRFGFPYSDIYMDYHWVGNNI
jgi:hypothetical protein